MKSKTAIVLFLSLVPCTLLFNSCNNKDKPTADNEIKVTGTESFTDSATSSVKVFDIKGRICIQQTNTFYELVDVYEGAAKIPLLLKIRKTEICFADSVNNHKVYEVEAHSILDTKNVQWNNKFVATQIAFKDNTLLATHEGSDAEEDFFTRFSLFDGKEVFSCSYGELKAVVPTVRNKRFIGYTSQRSATAPIQERGEENLLGIVRYASGLAPVNGAKIILKRGAVADR
ncbi:MAG: hypothetical protein V4615_08320, partial [Bacteroidota bacterium]